MAKILSPPTKLDNILFDVTRFAWDQGDDVMHGHSCIEMMFITSGSGMQDIGGRTYSLYPGCVTIIHPGCQHKIYNVKNIELYNVSCPTEPLDQIGVSFSFLNRYNRLFADDHSYCNLNLSGRLFFDVNRLLEQMFSLYQIRRQKGNQVKLRSLFSFLLVFLIQSWHPETEHTAGNIESVAEYLEEHYPEKITLKQLIHQFSMSQTRLLKRFCEKFNDSPMHYLQEVRMRHACEMLSETDLPIKGIAGKCGFYDGNYFIKVYKNKFNSSPNKMRKRMSKKSAI